MVGVGLTMNKNSKFRGLMDSIELDIAHNKIGVHSLYQLMLETLDAVEKDLAPKWVSVGDRLPVDGDDVLVYLNGVANITFMYTDDTDLLRYFDDFESDPPTHWQPLPAAPEAAK